MKSILNIFEFSGYLNQNILVIKLKNSRGNIKFYKTYSNNYMTELSKKDLLIVDHIYDTYYIM